MNIECLVNDALVLLGCVIFLVYHYFKYKDNPQSTIIKKPRFLCYKKCRLYLMEVSRLSEKKQTYQGYEIIKSTYVKGKEFVLGHNPNAVEPYATWKAKGRSEDYNQGHYFKTEKRAIDDFNRRVMNEFER